MLAFLALLPLLLIGCAGVLLVALLTAPMRWLRDRRRQEAEPISCPACAAGELVPVGDARTSTVLFE